MELSFPKPLELLASEVALESSNESFESGVVEASAMRLESELVGSSELKNESAFASNKSKACSMEFNGVCSRRSVPSASPEIFGLTVVTAASSSDELSSSPQKINRIHS